MLKPEVRGSAEASGRRSGRNILAVVLAAAFLPGAVAAQVPVPTPPPQLDQDSLDLITQSGVVQGAGARAWGMAGAFLARPDDATAASWNPAGLSYLRVPEVSVAIAHNRLESRVRDARGAFVSDVNQSGWTPDFVAGTYPISVGSASGAVQLGFQRVISFDYDRTIDQESGLRTIRQRGGFDVLAFASGLQVSRQVRVGLTLNRWWNGYAQEFERTVTNRPSRQSVDFEFSGWNLNLGAIWSPIESLNLGAVFKSSFTADVKLSRERSDFDADGSLLGSAAHESDSLEVDFPMAFGVGASWRPSSPLTLSADYTRTDWSSGTIRNYFILTSQRPPFPPEKVVEFDELPYPTLTDDQSDTEQVRLGLEYVVLRGRVRWPLRAGFFTDQQLFRSYDPGLDANSRSPSLYGLSAGTGIIIGRILADIAYVYEWGDYYRAPDTPEADPLEVGVRSHRFFLSLIYRHR